MSAYDVVVIGSGPKGPTAALTLARASLSVLVVEANDTIGGACRTETTDGFLHDSCASVHAMGRVSPVLRAVGIADGVEWAKPEIALAHPFDDGGAAILSSVRSTTRRRGSAATARAALRLMRPLVDRAAPLLVEALRGLHVPAHRVIDALAARLRERGGEILTGWRVADLRELPLARAYVFDVTPRQLLGIAGEQLPWLYRTRIARFRYGAGVFKLGYAMSGPVPWRNADCRRAGTVHLGGTFDEVAESEDLVRRGRHPERPFVLAAQPSVIDPTRAPAGAHAFWAYCHVPNGSTVDMRPRIEAQMERFAPGFRDLVARVHVRSPADLERENANLVGGHIGGGTTDATQLFTRPVARLDPYSTPNPRIFLCSSSTPPGGGVHGMCGYRAARSVLRRVFGKRIEETTPLPQTAIN